MRRASSTKYRLVSLVMTIFLALSVTGCEGDDGLDGLDGVDGAPGADGAAGSDGVACWDLNGNGVEDPEEDLNGDGVVDVLDCNAIASGAYESQKLHVGYFTEHEYTGTNDCLKCHGLVGADMLMRAHFTWEGVATNITGFETGSHGKNDLLNNFCIAVPTNEGRCAECHAGYGYDDKNFDFLDMKNVDCLVCHDQTGDYVKGKKNAGLPDPEANINLNLVAQSVAQNGGIPTIKNCIGCHAKAGGGNNVKHGDLALSLVNTTREFDVHMGSLESGGGGMDCVECHGVNKDPSGAVVDHGIGGMPYHSVDEGELKTCEGCHGDANSRHVGKPVESVITSHPQIACQVCHIPTFARNEPTKTEWLWSTAGDVDKGVVKDPDTGVPLYDPMKGSFVWENNVRPTLRYFDGKWNRFIIGANDTFTETPVVLGEPSADYTTVGAKIYPFKKMVGDQPADSVNNRILVPHLFGLKGGPNPYWVKYDWNLALQDGAAYTEQPYSGEYQFVPTVMYLTVNHEVAPREQAYGYAGSTSCGDCHAGDQIDWTELGWTDDPFFPTTPPRP